MFKRLKDLREDHDYTQKQIAEKLNMQQPQYQRYESGTVPPPIDSLIFLADLYDVSLDYLVERTNVKERYLKCYDGDSATIKECIYFFQQLNHQNRAIATGKIAELVKEQNNNK